HLICCRSSLAERRNLMIGAAAHAHAARTVRARASSNGMAVGANSLTSNAAIATTANEATGSQRRDGKYPVGKSRNRKTYARNGSTNPHSLTRMPHSPPGCEFGLVSSAMIAHSNAVVETAMPTPVIKKIQPI